MKQQSQQEVFKSVANRLVGQWHQQLHPGSLTFSLCGHEEDIADVEVIADGKSFRGFYTLFINTGSPVTIGFEALPKPMSSVIKILTPDTLVLQNANGQLDILQRQADIAFADDLIESI